MKFALQWTRDLADSCRVSEINFLYLKFINPKGTCVFNTTEYTRTQEQRRNRLSSVVQKVIQQHATSHILGLQESVTRSAVTNSACGKNLGVHVMSRVDQVGQVSLGFSARRRLDLTAFLFERRQTEPDRQSHTRNWTFYPRGLLYCTSGVDNTSIDHPQSCCRQSLTITWDKLVVERQSSKALSTWPKTVQFITLWASTIVKLSW